MAKKQLTVLGAVLSSTRTLPAVIEELPDNFQIERIELPGKYEALQSWFDGITQITNGIGTSAQEYEER